MLYNIKVVSLHCVFHGIRFKVNEDWVSVIDTLLFFYTFACEISSFLLVLTHHFSFARTKENEAKRKLAVCIFFLLQYFSSLNKKNSLRSNSFLFLTLQKALPLHDKKKRTELYLLSGWINFASLVLG